MDDEYLLATTITVRRGDNGALIAHLGTLQSKILGGGQHNTMTLNNWGSALIIYLAWNLLAITDIFDSPSSQDIRISSFYHGRERGGTRGSGIVYNVIFS